MLRLLAVTLGFWVAYRLRCRAAEGHRFGPLVLAAFWGLVVLAAVAGTCLAYLPFLWTTRSEVLLFAHRNFADMVPVHSFLVGSLAGYLLADQVVRLAQSPARRGGKEAAAPIGPGLLGTAIANGGVAVLMLAAIIPSSSFMPILGRLQNFEWGGVKLSFAGGNAGILADAIRTASPPRSIWAGNTQSSQDGFVPIRLETMIELTHPPLIEKPGENRGVFHSPSLYILAEPDKAATTSPEERNTVRTRRVQRDRAMLWQLARGAGDGQIPQGLEGRLQELGRTQESFLALFSGHVGCLGGFIDMTRDRRLVDYRTFHVVQELFVLAHQWSKAEKRFALEAIRGPARDRGTPPGLQTPTATRVALPPREDRSRRYAGGSPAGTNAQPGGATATEGGGAAFDLKDRLEQLNKPVDKFAKWVRDVSQQWSAAGTSPRKDRDTVDRCENAYNTTIPSGDLFGSFLNRLAHTSRTASRDMDMRASGFTPYIAIYVAQALSALEDHGAAIELLVDWLEDLEEIETEAHRHNRRELDQQIAWFRLQVLVEVLVLQKLSEGSATGVPTNLAALRALLDEAFPSAFRELASIDAMPIWRAGPSGCFRPEDDWKQAVTFSYLSFVKEYLDLLQRDLASDPRRLTAADLNRADLLANTRLECFGAVLGKVEDRPRRVVEFRTQFLTTVAAIRSLEYQASLALATPAEERNLRLTKAEVELQAAVSQLRAAQEAKAGRAVREAKASDPDTPQISAWRTRIFQDPVDETLRIAESALKHLENVKRKH
jgi:hypothetical protein